MSLKDRLAYVACVGFIIIDGESCWRLEATVVKSCHCDHIIIIIIIEAFFLCVVKKLNVAFTRVFCLSDGPISISNATTKAAFQG